MPRSGSQSKSASRPEKVAGANGDVDLQRLVRFSHIFASAVQEILETKLLQEVTPFPLTVSQFHLLKLMSMNGQHQVGQVADFLGVSPPAATKNVDKLERLGLLVRTPSQGDRRATLLSASPKGRRLVRKYEELKTMRLAQVLGRFDAGQVRQFSELLEHFAVSLLDSEQSGRCLRCAAYIASDCPVGDVCGGCPYLKTRGGEVGTRRT